MGCWTATSFSHSQSQQAKLLTDQLCCPSCHLNKMETFPRVSSLGTRWWFMPCERNISGHRKHDCFPPKRSRESNWWYVNNCSSKHKAVGPSMYGWSQKSRRHVKYHDTRLQSLWGCLPSLMSPSWSGSGSFHRNTSEYDPPALKYGSVIKRCRSVTNVTV